MMVWATLTRTQFQYWSADHAVHLTSEHMRTLRLDLLRCCSREVAHGYAQQLMDTLNHMGKNNQRQARQAWLSLHECNTTNLTRTLRQAQ